MGGEEQMYGGALIKGLSWSVSRNVEGSCLYGFVDFNILVTCT